MHCAVTLMAAACGDDGALSGGEALTAIGTGEKALNSSCGRLAGQQPDAHNWVKPFQDQTGCVVKSKIAERPTRCSN